MTWITGEKILEREGWGLGQDLINAYGERGLSPYREIDGARMTRGSKCFNCAKANRDYMPGKHDEHGLACLPLQLSSLRRDTGGLRIPQSMPSYTTAKEIDPELAEHFFATGEFTFDAGSIDITNARIFRFLTAMVGADVVEHMVLENVCDKCERMSPLYMGERLKAAKFKLKEVEGYEQLHGIGTPPVTALEVTTKSRRKKIMTISTKPGTTWSGIKLRIANNNRLEITIGNSMAPYNPQDLGFEPGRLGPVTMWGMLESFASHNGTLGIIAGKSNVRNFRKLLKGIFPDIKGAPVKHWNRNRGYQCEFQVSVSEHYLNSEHNFPDGDRLESDIIDVMKNER